MFPSHKDLSFDIQTLAKEWLHFELHYLHILSFCLLFNIDHTTSYLTFQKFQRQPLSPIQAFLPVWILLDHDRVTSASPGRRGLQSLFRKSSRVHRKENPCHQESCSNSPLSKGVRWQAVYNNYRHVERHLHSSSLPMDARFDVIIMSIFRIRPSSNKLKTPWFSPFSFSWIPLSYLQRTTQCRETNVNSSSSVYKVLSYDGLLH